MQASAEAGVKTSFGYDPDDWFGTGTLRRRVLDAWAASPARFREDANAEEDAALGAYRDRLVVELLQNAVDAAAAAGVPSRVRVRLRTETGELEVANNGTPLDAAGVEALSTLRASAKRDTSSVGKFGVGFAAVLAVTDEPSIVTADRGTSDLDASDLDAPDLDTSDLDTSSPRGVRWSKADTTAAVRDHGADGLRAELARRHGAVPVLRLPFPMAGPAAPPAGFDTVVRLPLRDAAAVELAHGLLAALDPTFPLVLPGLAEVVIDIDGRVRTLSCAWKPPVSEFGVFEPTASDEPEAGAAAPVPARGETRPTVEHAQLDGRNWVGVTRRGTIPANLLADRPVEERERTAFTARAMVCEGGWPDGVAQVVRAPQPTDEPISLPVLVSAELPLEPSRRHTVAGPLRDWLVDQLADAVADLAVHLGRSHDPLMALALVPTGLPAGEVDGRLRDQLTRLLPETPLFPGNRRGRDCAVLDLGPATDAVTTLLVPVDVARARDSHPTTPGDDLPGFRPALIPISVSPDEDTEPVVEGLLPAVYAARRWRPALAALGVRRLDTAAVVEALAGVRRPPSWWAELYSVMISAPDRDALGAVPVPLAALSDSLGDLDSQDGRGAEPGRLTTRMVTGPRGVLLPTDDLDVAALVAAGLPLRVAHPGACAGSARDALRTLGAFEGTPGGVLRDPAVREAVSEADPDDDQASLMALATAVLALVRDAGEGRFPDTGSADTGSADTGSADAVGADGVGVEGTAWLADLLLPDTDGGFGPAGELLVAGGPLDEVASSDAPFGTLDPAVADAWPVEVLEAVGVSRTFGVLRASMVTLDPDEPVLLDLDDSDRWVDDVADEISRAARRPPTPGPMAPPVLASFVAIRDLESVDRRSWPKALAELARPPLREVVLGSEPSYTRWWLSHNALLPVAGTDGSPDGTTVSVNLALKAPVLSQAPVLLPPTELTLPGADPLLTGLFSPAAPLPGVDDDLLRRLGARYTLDDVLGDLDGVLDLLDRLGDAERDVDWRAARTLYVAAVTAAGALAAGGGDAVDPPLTVRTPDGVVDAEYAVVVDAPDLLGLVGAGRSALRVPLDRAAEVGSVLGVPLATSLGECPVVSKQASTGLAPDGDTRYFVHERLTVADVDGRPTQVGWRVVGGIGGDIHVGAQAGTDALARALAWRAGVWHRRHALAAALRDPAGTAQRDAEDDLDDL